MGPAVIWFTGFSGAGKSALAHRLVEALQQRCVAVELLDGDVMRAKKKVAGFTRPERLAHLREMANEASELARRGKIVVGAFITPYEEARAYLRATCPCYIEVFVDTPFAECERRDVKGLYAKARKGEITHFTGIDDVFEVPQRPDIHIRTTGKSEEQCLAELLLQLERLLK